MAASSSTTRALPVLASFLLLLVCTAQAQLSSNFYASSCPTLQTIVRSTMQLAVGRDQRMAASILRLFFHDCFVNGCDASVLLADTATFTGEQNAFPNQNSIRGMGVIDTIKANVEAACRGTVSCADILALAARDGVFLVSSYRNLIASVWHTPTCMHGQGQVLRSSMSQSFARKRQLVQLPRASCMQAGGPSWTVLLGRRDARTSSQSTANNNLPASSSSLAALTSSFAAQGLSQRDLVALSGAHTIGFARCTTFRNRIYNDANIDTSFANSTAQSCPRSGGDNNLSPLDLQTSTIFDNAYYRNLVAQRGLLHSDQELFSTNNGSAGPTNSIVQSYVVDPTMFFSDFVAAMVRMGNISPLTGTSGEIRLNCSRVN
ncbi:hypothetical protein Taro_052481 [Colocasia esculenta]|uniref:Peroxidase n=1 Tax=Colocasia esculenta TaxID=4460 RepID=A0A843XK69_COLES|nr:hypothetical protein [Colocasia esculenta]